MNGHHGQNTGATLAVRGVRWVIYSIRHPSEYSKAIDFPPCSSSVPGVHERALPGVKRPVSAGMTSSGSSRSGSGSSKRRKTAGANDRFDGMIRRTQRHGSGTGSIRNSAPSSSKRTAAKKKLASNRANIGNNSIQELRADCVGRDFAVLKPQGQETPQDDHNLDKTDPDQTKQGQRGKSLPTWLLNTFALLPRTHPLQKLTPARSGSPSDCGEPNSSSMTESGDPFPPAMPSPTELNDGMPFRSPLAPTPTRPLLSGHSIHASQAQSYQGVSTQAHLDEPSQELFPTAWPFCLPEARGATDYTAPPMTSNHSTNIDDDLSTFFLSPFVPKTALAVDFQSIDHSPVVSDLTTSTLPAHSKVLKHSMNEENSPCTSRFGIDEWPGVGETPGVVSPSPPRDTCMASPTAKLFHPSPRRYKVPGVLEFELGSFDIPEQALTPIVPEGNAARNFDQPPSDDGASAHTLLGLVVKGRHPGTLPPTFGLNLKYTDPTTIARAFASPDGDWDPPAGHVTSPLSPTIAPDCDFFVTTPHRPQLNFVPFQTPHFYCQQARSNVIIPTQGGATSPRIHEKTDRYAEELVAYAAKMNRAETPLPSAQKLLFHSNGVQRDRNFSLRYESSGGSTAENSPPEFRRRGPVRDGEAAMNPSSELSEGTFDSTSPWSSRLMELPQTNVRASEGRGQTIEVDG
ncbi:hypothetical protein M407DRAFT_20577 [Tulasnella calospora MUT 4182]|uniref:Uncharacterized protein n=1 Tax=Tulasnella calospora MUT 4182 TaxID=1051891 RepID=A0A0C3M9D0_9AGAM|nr:hypothetical protein M407DRAFT_20577 [Tulasnella calospora MUT 4182]